MVELSPAQIKRQYRNWQQVEETFRLLKQEFGWGGSSTRKAEAQTTHLHLGLMAICLTQQALSLRSRRSIPSSVGDFVSRSRTNSRSWNTFLSLRNFSKKKSHLSTVACLGYFLRFLQSGREDSNLRPPGPKPGALPDCATPRNFPELQMPTQ